MPCLTDPKANFSSPNGVLNQDTVDFGPRGAGAPARVLADEAGAEARPIRQNQQAELSAPC